MSPRHPVPSPLDATASQSAADTAMWRPSLAYLAIALGLVLGGVAFLWLSPSLPPEQGDEGGQPARLSASASAALAASPPHLAAASGVARSAPTPTPMPDLDPTRDLSSYVMRGEKPTMPEVIARLHRAGIHDGLAAFSPPGTRPPMIGLAVPEDFVLPEGYVRHHQATDDGQRIEAILMFAPDRQFFDAAKRLIIVPANRVVPPEHAPPGLPIRHIVLPKPIDPAGH